MEGFLFPALYEFTQYTNGTELVSDQVAAFGLRPRQPLVCALEEPDAVRRAQIASMIEKETVAPRSEARRGGDLQPAASKMPLGIDATLRYGLNIQAPSR